MKCVILVVLMALAAVNAGSIKISPAPVELNYLPHAAWDGYAGWAGRSFYPYSSYFGGFKALPMNADVEPIAAPIVEPIAAPLPVPYPAPLPLAYSAPIVAPAPASVAVDLSSPTYIASTPGAKHIAPLPGHSDSVILENLLPALGNF